MNQNPKQLKGIWWNVLYEARDDNEGAEIISDKIADLIKRHDLDWLCLQEAFCYRIEGDKRDLIEQIKKKTGWEGAFVPHAEYHYENGERKQGDNYRDGIAIFSKWPMKKNSIKKLNPSPDRFYGDIGTHLLEITLETNYGPVVVANTHLTWMSVKNLKHRNKEMKVFQQHVKDIKSSPPYVIGGDFNTLSSHPFIVSVQKYIDLQTSSPIEPTWRYRGKKKYLLRANIDYVGTFIPSAIEMTNFEVLNAYPSDHSPLLCTFKLRSTK